MRQSFAWWAFRAADKQRSDRELLAAAADCGIAGVEMLDANLYPMARDLGLSLVSITGHDIDHGFNDYRLHPELRDAIRRQIADAHDNGVGAVIVFAGKRADRTHQEGIDATTNGLAALSDEAASAGVALWLELLNSKVDHPDHQCDNSAFAFEVIRRIDSPAVRVLYDCYHMQTMEGDLLNTIASNIDLIGHIHTGGVPGRRELDDHQETNWRAVAGLLRAKNYSGWVGHEFLPRGDAVESLNAAHQLFAD